MAGAQGATNDRETAMPERVAVHPVYHPSGAYRVVVYRRADGCYVHAVEARCLFDADAEPDWTAEFDFHESRSGVYSSPETALSEAERDIPWLRSNIGTDRSPSTPFPTSKGYP